MDLYPGKKFVYLRVSQIFERTVEVDELLAAYQKNTADREAYVREHYPHLFPSQEGGQDALQG